jgi:hypothetical protein
MISVLLRKVICLNNSETEYYGILEGKNASCEKATFSQPVFPDPGTPSWRAGCRRDGSRK